MKRAGAGNGAISRWCRDRITSGTLRPNRRWTRVAGGGSGTLLEKISRYGLNSLTDSEREILQRASAAGAEDRARRAVFRL